MAWVGQNLTLGRRTFTWHGYLLLRGALGAVFRAALLAVRGAGCIQRPADDVITNAREIFDAAAAYEHHRMLLQIVADARNVRGYFFAVGQPYTRDFTQR